jgi:hypothetical protein
MLPTPALSALLLSVLQPGPAVREPACPGQYGAFDQFGVAELNPTKKGGREWFIDPPNFSTDPHVTYGSHTGNTPVLMCDDSIQTDELSDAGFEGARIQIGTLWDAGEVAWNQTEMTAYVFLEDYSPSTDTMWRLDLYSKSGGTHNKDPDCASGAYHNELGYDGRVYGTRKEVFHKGGYTQTPSRYQFKWKADAGHIAPLQGRWVGWKVVTRNTSRDGGACVNNVMYYDDSMLLNQWTEVAESKDCPWPTPWGGGWDSGAVVCGHHDSDVLTGAYQYVTFRCDSCKVDWRFLSVREIQ